jgi:hypothetical protein
MSSRQPRLIKPVVIPRRNYNGILTTGKPFARAWAPALEAFGIMEDEFLKFIDGLNGAKQGNEAWGAVGQVGGLVGKFASLDPSGVTSIVGHSIKGVALIGGTVSKRGPYALKVSYLKSANEKLFGPKGLSVQIIDTENLRVELGLKPDVPIVLPLDPATMSMGQKDKKGPHRLSALDSAHRVIRALTGHISGVFIYGATSVNQQRDSDAIAKISVKTELDIQLQRQKAINCLQKAKQAKTEDEKQKYLKQSASYDTEVKMAEDSVWLLVRDLDRTLIQPGETYTASTLYKGGIKYTGEFRDDEQHGKGVLTDPDGTTYAGEFANGKKHGQGCIRYSTGAYLTGSFLDGKQNGLGTVYSLDGGRFSGGYKDAKRHGPGVISWADGRFEKVEYKEGKANGFSTYGDIKGGIWYAIMRNGEVVGDRVEITEGSAELPTQVPGGYTWRGGIKNGEPHGYGMAQWPSTGQTYVGFWETGESCGWGAFTNKQGDRATRDRNNGPMKVVRGSFSQKDGYFWIGKWDGDRRTGDGAARFPNGDQYIGKFVDGIPSGEGRYIWKNGDVDTGVFTNGALNGFGKRIRKDVFIYTGGFQNSQFHGHGVWYFNIIAARCEATFQQGKPKAFGASWQGRQRVPAEFKVWA